MYSWNGNRIANCSTWPSTKRPPFPLALDDFASVLAVKGTLRRFAPLTASGRCEGMTVYEGKGGVWIISQ